MTVESEIYEERNALVVVEERSYETGKTELEYEKKKVITIQVKTLPFGISFGLSMNPDTAKNLKRALDRAIP